MDDVELVQEVAAEHIARMGSVAAIDYLLQWEEMARKTGDDVSADAWLDIARAVAEQSGEALILSSGRPPARAASRRNDRDRAP
jgi:hypothetical protein